MAMNVYEKILTSAIRFFAQLSPTELEAFGYDRSPSSAEFYKRNLFILLVIGGGSALKEYVDIREVRESERSAAMTLISVILSISIVGSFYFLVIRNIYFWTSHSREGQSFRKMFPSKKERTVRDKFANYLNALGLILGVTPIRRPFSLMVEVMSERRAVVIAATCSAMVSHVYTLLFAAKLMYMANVVRRHFRIFNAILARNVAGKRSVSRCTALEGEWEQIFQRYWEGRGFFDYMNNRYGAEFFITVLHMYLTVLYTLYYASFASGIFARVSKPDTFEAMVSIFRSVQCLLMACALFGSCTLLKSQMDDTLEIVWDSTSTVRCQHCQEKLKSFAFCARQLSTDLTAKGIFNMNMKTFSNLISSVATQLVILISLGSQ